MNYILCHKWIFLLGIICLFSAFSYTILYNFDGLVDDPVLINGISGDSLSKLLVFNLERLERWDDYAGEGDLFTSAEVLSSIDSIEDKGLNLVPKNLSRSESDSIRLDGWANIKGKMIFVFSFGETNTSFLGSIGDTFENPSFTVLSFDFKDIESCVSGYLIPMVTILDNEINERVVLTPVSCSDLL